MPGRIRITLEAREAGGFDATFYKLADEGEALGRYARVAPGSRLAPGQFVALRVVDPTMHRAKCTALVHARAIADGDEEIEFA